MLAAEPAQINVGIRIAYPDLLAISEICVKKNVSLQAWCPKQYIFWLGFSFAFLIIFELSDSVRTLLANAFFPLENGME